MTGSWGDGHGLADDIPVVLWGLGFGCGGTPKTGPEQVEWENPATAVTAPGTAKPNQEVRHDR
jgi:hypothetical protein